jgi:hypothetical protein
MRSTIKALEFVIDCNVRTVIYAGDEDYIVNYLGVEAMVRARVLRFSLPLLPPSLPAFANALTIMTSLCKCMHRSMP